MRSSSPRHLPDGTSTGGGHGGRRKGDAVQPRKQAIMGGNAAKSPLPAPRQSKTHKRAVIIAALPSSLPFAPPPSPRHCRRPPGVRGTRSRHFHRGQGGASRHDGLAWRGSARRLRPCWGGGPIETGRRGCRPAGGGRTSACVGGRGEAASRAHKRWGSLTAGGGPARGDHPHRSPHTATGIPPAPHGSHASLNAPLSLYPPSPTHTLTSPH